MTIVFHRLAIPSYFGGLPAGFDYINNATSGTPAFANGVLTTGPNVGSYFVGFQDDGTSADANRSAAALATNTDYLDNVVHAPLAYVTQTNNVTPGAPVPSVTLTGPGIFLGISGATPLTELFEVTDANDNAIEISGVAIQVASVTGGAVGSGFSAGNVTITFNLSIPATQTYRVYYGIASNLANLPADAFFASRLGLRSDDADFLDFVRQVSLPGRMPGDVSSIVASNYATPDGSRLPQQSQVIFDTDSYGSSAPVKDFLWTAKGQTVDVSVIASLSDDPTSSIYPGITSSFLLQGGARSALGTSVGGLAFTDANLQAGAPTNFIKAVPLSSTTATNGDQFLRTMDVLPASGSPATASESVLQRLNAQYACTVGDGTTTFGDFNGITGLDQALAYFAASSLSSCYIQLKAGTFTIGSTHTFAAGKTLTIEGQGFATTVEVGLGGSAAFSLTGARFFMRNLTFLNSTATLSHGIAGSSPSAVSLDNVIVVDLVIATKDAGVLPNGMAFSASNCTFYVVSAGGSAVILSCADGGTHSGYVFDTCKFICSDETTPVTITTAAVSASAGTISAVIFRDCIYSLGGTATTSGHLTHNTGIISIDPGTSGVFNFIVADVTWDHCSCTTATSAQNNVIAYIMPVGIGAAGLSNLAAIERITMKDCSWSAAPGVSSALSTFVLSAMSVIIKDTEFAGTGKAGNAQSSDVALCLGEGAVAVAEWAQFSIVTSYLYYGLTSGDISLSMDNVSFVSMTQNSDAGDLRLDLPVATNAFASSSSLKNIRLQDYIAGGSGAVPHYRVNISPTVALGVGEVDALVEQLILQGTTGTGTSAWAQFGLIGVQPQSGLELRKCVPLGFAPGSGPNLETGFYLNYGAGLQLYDITFRDCKASGYDLGLFVPQDSSSSSPLDGLCVLGGVYSNNSVAGVSLQVNKMGVVRIEDVRADGNGDWGISVQVLESAGLYPTVTQQMLYIEDNHCQGNGGSGAVGIQVLAVQSVFVRMTAFGNTVIKSDGSQGNFQVVANSTALTSPGGYPLIGVETGIAALGDGAAKTFLVSGDPMMFNYGALQTP